MEEFLAKTKEERSREHEEQEEIAEFYEEVEVEKVFDLFEQALRYFYGYYAL